MLALPELVTAKSGLASPSRSPKAMVVGFVPAVISTFEAKEDAAILPEIAVLRRIETVAPPLLATARSNLPSPSISHAVTFSGLAPTVKSTLAAKDALVMLPDTDVFRNIETEALPRLATARSIFPSPSKSPASIVRGLAPVPKFTPAAKEAELNAVFTKAVFRKTEILAPQ